MRICRGNNMFKFNLESHEHRHIHFIGIGGISMSGLAGILLDSGYEVSGSDMKPSATTDKLMEAGAKIFFGHKPENLDGVDLVVYTDAISLDNSELKYAIETKLDIIDRASFLGALMKNYKYSIAVSGTHGKTSTTSIITEIIENDPSNPTILIGGQLDSIHGNVKLGNKNLFLTEACEYKSNILKYYPTIAIVLNIDEDHLDFFDNIDHIIETFVGYAENLDETSHLILNVDDENTRKLIGKTKANITTFGIDRIADFTAKNLTLSDEGYPSYQMFHKHKMIAEIKLNVMGKHNIYNSMAAFIATYIYGIEPEKIVSGIADYYGVHRRLEFKGNVKGATVIDDYAHHPTEIKTTLNAIRNRYSSDIYCIFQPHTYTRTKLLLNSFSESFDDADKIIITDIFAAREKDYGDIHSKALVEAIRAKGKDAIYIESFEDVEKYLLANVHEDDCIITMGAGDVYLIGENLLKANEENTIQEETKTLIG